MSKQPQSAVQSFFQVGGIHGLPYVVWDGATGDPSNSEWSGYCTHGSVVFPTWHRPYVMLYEVCSYALLHYVLMIDQIMMLLANFATAG